MKALPEERGGALPQQMDWLYQVISHPFARRKERAAKSKIEQAEDLFRLEGR